MTETTQTGASANYAVNNLHFVVMNAHCDNDEDIGLAFGAACEIDEYINTLRAERDAANARVRVLEDYASHLEMCRTCAEDGTDRCDVGSVLRLAAQTTYGRG